LKRDILALLFSSINVVLFQCPVECRLKNRASLPLDDMTYLSPSFLDDDGTQSAHVVLLALYDQTFISIVLVNHNFLATLLFDLSS